MLIRFLKSILSKARSAPKVILLIIGILLLYTLIRNVVRYRDINLRLSSSRESLSELHDENERLLEEVSSVKTIGYIEAQARDKLGLAYEGETVLVLPDEATLRKLSPRLQKVEETKLPDPNWKKWWNLFF